MSATETERTIGLIHALANHCSVEFHVTNDYYEDAEPEVYVFNNTRFLDGDKCLVYANHYREVWDVKECSRARMREVEVLEAREKKLIIIQDALELGSKVQAKRIKLLEEVNFINDKEISTQIGFNESKSKIIRSLRSRLGHAKRKINKMRGY